MFGVAIWALEDSDLFSPAELAEAERIEKECDKKSQGGGGKDGGKGKGKDKGEKCDKEKRRKIARKRPVRYRKGVVEKVWENAKSRGGKVYDPNTLEELTWDRSKTRHLQWDMGHKPGKSYDSLKKRYINCIITRKQMLDEYNDANNYRPEAYSFNRSRQGDTN